MLSGGRDSVCMLDLAVRAAGAGDVDRPARQLRPARRLRPTTSAAAPSSATRWASSSRPSARCAPEGPGNLQAWARDVRYAAAARLALAREATIVTGHTADDQVETILYRLASSPSRRALLGMRAARRPARPAAARHARRAEITAYCEQRGLAWREDATNAESTFARNRVRHGLLPALEAIHPAAAANVLRTAGCCATRPRCSTPWSTPRSTARPGATRSPSRGSPTCTPALRRLVLQRLADGAAGRPVPGAAGYAEQVAGLRRTGTAMLDLGGRVRAVVEGGVLRAERDR